MRKSDSSYRLAHGEDKIIEIYLEINYRPSGIYAIGLLLTIRVEDPTYSIPDKSMPDQDNSDGARVSRRRTLGLIGSGALGMGLASGVGSANPGQGTGRGGVQGGTSSEGSQGVGPCTCPDGCPEGSFCGKIDNAPEKGKTYTFNSGSDQFSVTIDDVTTKDDENEVTCFTFSSDDDIQQVCVKGGPDTVTYSDDLEGQALCAPTNPGGQQAAISNVSFCGTGGKGTCFQLDLVVGEPIEEFDGTQGRTYHQEERFLKSFCVCLSDDESASGPQTRSASGCEVSWDSFEFDSDSGEATISVELLSTSDSECEITFAGYRLPEGVRDCPGELEDQVFVDADTQSLSETDEVEFSIQLE